MTAPDTHPEAVALYRAILANPDEDTPRLVFADWLEEHGDEKRAEFIRLQCRLARMNEWDDGYAADRVRAARLQREFGKAWWPSPKVPATFRPDQFPQCQPLRGFPSEVIFKPEYTPEQAREWFSPHPITHANLSFRYAMDRIQERLWHLTTDALPALRVLKLYLEEDSAEFRTTVCETLAAAKCRSGLTRLEITGTPPLAGLEAIVTSPHLRRLEALSIRGDGVGDDHARLLAEKMNLPALRELAFGFDRPHSGTPGFNTYRGLTAAGAAALGGAAWLDQLHRLHLSGHRELGDAGLEALLGGRALPELRTLKISHCGEKGAEMRLGGSEGLPGLVVVDLAGNNPTGDSLRKLVSGPQRFQSLTLGCERLIPADVIACFAAPAVRDLRRLAWSERLTLGAISALAGSPVSRSLRSLSLHWADWNLDAISMLLAGAGWPALERLELGRVRGESITSLIESKKFPRLVSLKLSCEDGETPFLRRLAKCPAAARVRELDIRARLTATTARALADSPHLSEIDWLTLRRGSASPDDCARLVERFGARVGIWG